MQENPFVVAGVDLKGFVDRWVAEVDAAEPAEYPFVDMLRDEATSETDRAFAGQGLARQFIGPRVVGEAGSDEELLLFAVICTFPMDDPTPWSGMHDFVRRAFRRFHAIGAKEIARTLREDILIHSGSPADDPALERVHELRRRSMKGDPARMAAHDQVMAQMRQRSLRAARLLDPEGEKAFWIEFMSRS